MNPEKFHKLFHFIALALISISLCRCGGGGGESRDPSGEIVESTKVVEAAIATATGAGNGHGTSNGNGNAGSPDVPGAVTVRIDYNQYLISLEWLNPRPVTGNVLVELIGFRDRPALQTTENRLFNANASPVALTSLLPSVRYFVRMCYANSLGACNSPWSARTSFRTRP